MRVCVCVLNHSVMSDSATPWTVACHSPLSMGFSRQEYRMGCHFLLQGIFPTQGSNWGLLHWQADSSLSESAGKPCTSYFSSKKKKQRNQKERAFGWDVTACVAEWRPSGSRKAFSDPRILLHHFHRAHEWVAAPESYVIHMVEGAGCPARRCSARMKTRHIFSISPPESPEGHWKQHCYLMGRLFPWKLFPSVCLCKCQIHREAGKRNDN